MPERAESEFKPTCQIYTSWVHPNNAEFLDAIARLLDEVTPVTIARIVFAERGFTPPDCYMTSRLNVDDIYLQVTGYSPRGVWTEKEIASIDSLLDDSFRERLIEDFRQRIIKAYEGTT